MATAAPLPEVIREKIRHLVRRDGERLAVKRLGVGRQTLARALAGLPIYPGTQALIRQRLDAAEQERTQ